VADSSWFAGARVVGARGLYDTENDEFAAFVRSIRIEAIVSYAFLSISVALAVAAANVNISLDWTNLIMFSAAMGILRYLPQRRFTSLTTLLRLRRDTIDRSVWLCRAAGLSIEVLRNSHFIWRQNGVPLLPAVRVREVRIAMPPAHASMAANFVKPLADREEILTHQRALSDDERGELDAHVPPPSVSGTTLTIVSGGGAIWSYQQAAAGFAQTLLPAFALSIVSVWLGRSTYRKYAARKRFETDINAAVVLIIRTREGDITTPASEFLPGSGLPWTENGIPASWRTVRS
jgi:hypothetical protein